MAASAGVGASANMAGQQQQNITDGKPAPPKVDPATVQQDLAAAQAAASAVSATTVSTTDGGQQIAPLESAYNTAVNKLVADLQARDAYLQWEVGQTSSSTSNRQTWGSEIAANTKMINDIQAGTGMPHDGAVAKGTVAGPGGIVDGSKNPGSMGQPSPSGWGAAGAAGSLAASTPNCAGGYVAPPAIPPNADMNQVVGNLTNDQAYFLGWSVSQMLDGKQVAVPPQDAQAWSAMQQWMLTNNPYFTGKGMPSGTPQNTQNAMNLTALATGQCKKMSPDQIIELVMGAVTAVAMVPGGVGAGIAEGAAQTGVEVAGRSSLAAETEAGSVARAGGAAADTTSNTVGNDSFLANASAKVDPPSGGAYTLEKDDSPLFGAGGEPSPADADQGPIGDCWFVSVLRSLARKNPEFIKDNIKDMGDGTYSVKLYDQQGAEHDVMVDDTMPYTGSGPATAGGNGTNKWASLYEKAAAKLSEYTAQKPGANGYDTLEGGYETDAVQMLTGSKGQDNHLARNADGAWGTQAAGGAWSYVDSDDLFALMQNATGPSATPADRAFANFDASAATESEGLVAEHSYEVIGVSGSGDNRMVTLSNPHGFNDPSLTASPGVTVNGDQVTLPWNLFLERASVMRTT